MTTQSTDPTSREKAATSTRAFEFEWSHEPSNLDAAVSRAGQFGFRHVSLVLLDPLSGAPTLPEMLVEDVARLRSANIEPVAVADVLAGPVYPIDRQRTRVRSDIQRVMVLLDAAVRARLPFVSLSVASGGSAVHECRYNDELCTHVLEVMHAVRYEAEMRAIQIALSVGDGFLNSLSEARAFIDECNSPWIGARLSITQIATQSQPVDWVLSLGRRIVLADIRLRDLEPTAGLLWNNALGSLKALEVSCPIIVDGEGLTDDEILLSLSQLRKPVSF